MRDRRDQPDAGQRRSGGRRRMGGIVPQASRGRTDATARKRPGFTGQAPLHRFICRDSWSGCSWSGIYGPGFMVRGFLGLPMCGRCHAQGARSRIQGGKRRPARILQITSRHGAPRRTPSQAARRRTTGCRIRTAPAASPDGRSRPGRMPRPLVSLAARSLRLAETPFGCPYRCLTSNG